MRVMASEGSARGAEFMMKKAGIATIYSAGPVKYRVVHRSRFEMESLRRVMWLAEENPTLKTHAIVRCLTRLVATVINKPLHWSVERALNDTEWPDCPH